MPCFTADSKIMWCLRGMLIEDESGDISWKNKKYKRTLNDYPYADDGLLIWDALQRYFSAYLKVKPPSPRMANVDCNLSIEAEQQFGVQIWLLLSGHSCHAAQPYQTCTAATEALERQADSNELSFMHCGADPSGVFL